MTSARAFEVSLRAGALLGGCLAVVAGCDPVAQVRGAVVDPHAHALADAVVALHCPEFDRHEPGEPVLVAFTGADGRFEMATLGELSADCRIEVRRDGYATRTLRLGDLCPSGKSTPACDHSLASDRDFSVVETKLELSPLPASTP